MSLAVRMPLVPLLDRTRSALVAHTGWLVIIGVLTGNIRRLAVRHVYNPTCKARAPARATRFYSIRNAKVAAITPDDMEPGRIDRVGSFMPRDPAERLTARAIREQRNISSVVVERLSSVGAVARVANVVS